MIEHWIAALICAAAFAALTLYLLNQVRSPTRWTGRVFLSIMNRRHSELTDWGLKHLQIGTQSTILDVGCGGGRTIGKLAGIATSATVHGIDYAEGSVAAARATNAQLIRAGRVVISKASVSELPFAEDQFDLVTAVETHYYWPNPVDDMREILRALRPGAMLIVIAETYGRAEPGMVRRSAMGLLRTQILSAVQHRQIFESAGFTDVKIFEESNRGWICGIGKKPCARTSGATAF